MSKLLSVLPVGILPCLVTLRHWFDVSELRQPFPQGRNINLSSADPTESHSEN